MSTVTNLFTNPSVETDSTTVELGTTGVRDTTRAHVGTHSIKSSDGLAWWSAGGLLPNTVYTASAWVYISSSVTGVVTTRIGNPAVTASNGPEITERDQWVRVSRTFTTNAVGGALAWYPARSGDGDRWADAVMLTEGPDLHDYFDGDTSGNGLYSYRWTGVPHGSDSQRIAGARLLISEAASSVEGINVSPYYRQVTRSGQGFIQYRGSDRDSSGFGFMTRWAAVIVLPQDIAAAETYLDTHLDALLSAVGEALIVTNAEPITLATDQGSTIPALSVEGVLAN